MLEWILSSCVLILAVVGLRYLLRGRLSLRLQYAMWLIVLLRLLLPVSLGSSRVSVTNALPQGVPVFSEASEPADTLELTQTAADLPYSEAPSAQPGLNVEELLFALWLIGVCMLLLWFAAVNIRLWRKLRHSRRMVSIENFPLKVYITDEAETPCLFGLLRPAVYLTLETPLEGPALRHVLEHELAHRRQGDHIWALLRGLCLALHWYNPLVWWAASLSKRDAELACDEAAVRRLGEGERADYGRTLLGLSCRGRPDLLRAATTMTGGKRALRERIRMLAKRPHTAHYALVLLLLAAGALAGCTFTGAEKTEADPPDALDEPVGDVASSEAADWEAAWLEFWDGYNLAEKPQHQGFQLIDLEFDGVPELIVWFAGGPANMYSELYRLDEGGAELVGGYSANLVKGETGVGDLWPEPTYLLVRSRDDGAYFWCVSNLSASEQGRRGAWVLFQGGRPVELAAFEDGPGEDAGRQAVWEQFDAAYELVSWNSSASTLSLFDGDDISRDGLEGLLEAWTEAGAVGA